MGQCLVHRMPGAFKAFLQIQANPGATVTATLGNKVFSAVADGTTGIATITVKKKGTYALSSDCPATEQCVNNNGYVTASKSNQTYTGLYVKLNKGYSSFAVDNTYGSNTLVAYWDGTKPDEYCTSYYVEEVTSSGNAGKYTGTGTSQVISASSTLNGYRETVASGTAKTYQLSSFITINGKSYYGAFMTASGTAQTYSAEATNVTATQTLTVPEGCRSITAFVVGGGGAGGYGYYSTHSTTNYDYDYYHAGAGGGGGYQTTSSIPVIPGQSISCVIGSSKNKSSVSCNDQNILASAGGTPETASVSNSSPQGGSGYRNGGAILEDGGDSDNGYSGGGGGGGYVSRKEGYLFRRTFPGDGGAGGGGAGGFGAHLNGESSFYQYPVAGTANTGGGGGGGCGAPGHINPAAGGSGFIKVTYNF